MHTLTFLFFGVSAAAMFVVLVKTMAVLNLLIVEKRSAAFFSELDDRWRLLFAVAPVGFFSTLAALTHIMGERGVSLIVYGAFGVSSTLMIVGVIAIVGAPSKGPSQSFATWMVGTCCLPNDVLLVSCRPHPRHHPSLRGTFPNDERFSFLFQLATRLLVLIWKIRRTHCDTGPSSNASQHKGLFSRLGGAVLC